MGEDVLFVDPLLAEVRGWSQRALCQHGVMPAMTSVGKDDVDREDRHAIASCSAGRPRFELGASDTSRGEEP